MAGMSFFPTHELTVNNSFIILTAVSIWIIVISTGLIILLMEVLNMKDTLNPNEWIVMEALWAESPSTLGETIERIGDKVNWGYKTYQSYVNVLEKKGYVSAVKRGRDKFYSPAVSREECISRESKAILGRMESRSLGLMVTSMVREGDLSKGDRLELMEMLERMLKEEQDGKNS